MEWWQLALLALGVLWALQSVGTWVQMRHYQQVMAGIGDSYKDGYLGTGNARGTVGRGLIVMLVASPQGVVRKALAMEGRTVFARFQEIPELSGVTLDELGRAGFFGEGQKAREKAFALAIKQIKELQSAKNRRKAVAGAGKGAAAKKASRSKRS